jgi:hypothetical protein
MTRKGKGRALHVGLNKVDPKHYQGWDGELLGCENDARDLAAIAEQAGFDVTTILTADGTADAVTTAIGDAAKELADGDLFWLTYSGHGSQVPDKNSDEPDRSDETWVLFDRQLVDDELYDLWSAHVLLISGCQDNQTSADGAENGLFTQTLLTVWDGGAYKGGHKRFYKEIVAGMPPWQSPNWMTAGPTNTSFHRRRPFTI